jgi:hypothetical protein
MNNSHDTKELVSEAFTQPPFLYEIRVKGRLANERWTDWFDDLTISTSGGETTLQGRALDHAALYGLLARLRDLAIPLVAVRVLDAEAQRKLRQASRRYDLMINLLLVAVYLAMLGGLAAVTVFIAPIINVALAMSLLFAALGGLAHAFWLWSDQGWWRWITYVAWPTSALTLLIFVAVAQLLPTTLAIALILFCAAGGVLYLIYALRRRAENLQSSALSTDETAPDDQE